MVKILVALVLLLAGCSCHLPSGTLLCSKKCAEEFQDTYGIYSNTNPFKTGPTMQAQLFDKNSNQIYCICPLLLPLVEESERK